MSSVSVVDHLIQRPQTSWAMFLRKCLERDCLEVTSDVLPKKHVRIHAAALAIRLVVSRCRTPAERIHEVLRREHLHKSIEAETPSSIADPSTVRAHHQILGSQAASLAKSSCLAGKSLPPWTHWPPKLFASGCFASAIVALHVCSAMSNRGL